MPPSEFDLLRTITELTVQMKSIVENVKRLDDLSEGTVERKGMKERIAIAEFNIDENKKAYVKMETTIKEMEARINTTLREAFVEISKRIDSVGHKNVIARIQPYVSLVGWIVLIIICIVVLSQFASGNLQIVRVK